MTRENYTFVNWNTKADGTGTSYNSDSNFTGNENITLYAIWQVNSTTSTINANRYICSSYNGTNRLSIFYITTKTIVNNNQSCAYTKLNGLGSASDFSKNLYSTNPSWSIDCYDLEETLSSKCKAPAYYIKANGGLNCRSGASLDTSYRGDWALSNCTKLDSIYLTTSKMNNGTDNWYYDSNTGCYLRGNYLSSSNPCSSSGGSSSNDWCHCSDDIDCAGMTEYNNFCNGGVCYYKKPEWTTASAGCK